MDVKPPLSATCRCLVLSYSRPADDITCSMLVVLLPGGGWLLSGGIKVWCVCGVGGGGGGWG